MLDNNNFRDNYNNDYWPVAAAKQLGAQMDELRKSLLTATKQQDYTQLINKIDALTRALQPAPSVPLGDQILILSPTVDARLTPPTGAKRAVIQNLGCDVLFRFNLSPTSTNGYRQYVDGIWQLTDPTEISKIILRAAPEQSGKIIITYFS